MSISTVRASFWGRRGGGGGNFLPRITPAAGKRAGRDRRRAPLYWATTAPKDVAGRIAVGNCNRLFLFLLFFIKDRNNACFINIPTRIWVEA